MRQIRYIILFFLFGQCRYADSQSNYFIGQPIVHSIKTSIDTLLFCTTDNFKEDSLTSGIIQTFLNRQIIHTRGGKHPYKCSFGKEDATIIQYALSYDPKSKLYTEIPGITNYYWVKGDSIKFSRELVYNIPTLSQVDINAVTNYFYKIDKRTDFTKLRDQIMMLFYCSLNGDKKAYEFWNNLDKFFTSKTYLIKVYGGDPSATYIYLDGWMKNLKYGVKNWH